MTDERADFLTPLLMASPPRPSQQRCALATLFVSTAFFVVALPLAKWQLPTVWAFLPIYQSALIVISLITAAFVLGQLTVYRSWGLVFLAGGYCFVAEMATVHSLSFPGLITPSGLLSTGPQTTAWLYFLWHGGLPLFLIGYTLVRNSPHDPLPAGLGLKTVAVLTFGAVTALVGALTLLVTMGHDLLPVIMSGDLDNTTKPIVASATWLIGITALVLLWRHKPHSLMDLWLMIALCVLIFDSALAGVFNHGRFDLGWYAGRLYGLVGASVLLITQLLEISELYRQLALRRQKEQAEAAKQLFQSKARFQATFEQAAVGIALVAPDGHWLKINRKLCSIVGYSADELMGMTFQDITHPDDLGTDIAQVWKMLAGEIQTYTMEKRYIHKNGATLWVNLSVALIRNEDQNPECFVSVVDDITERKKAEAQLHESRQRLQLFVDHAPAALALFDRDMCYLAASRRWLEDYGLGDIDIIGRSHYEIFPEITDEWKAIHLRGMEGETVTADGDRFVRADGNVQWLRWEVRPWFASDGIVGGVIIFTEDITGLKLAENQLRITARIYDQAGEAILVTNPDTVIETVNSAFTKITGYSPEEAIGQPVSFLQSGTHSDEYYRAMWQALRTDGYWQGEIVNHRKNGEAFPEWLTINRIDNDQGEVAHYVAVFSDISQIKESQRKAEYLSTHDALTGLPNRALFQDRLQLAIARAKRTNKQLALLFVDLDNFKIINDTLGHNIGDELLQQVSQRLKQSVRDIDTIARLGGDEFTAIITDCSIDGVEQVAARTCADLSSVFHIDGHSIYATASVGIALFPEDGDDPVELVRSADAAMYRAKEQGRNQAVFFKPDLHHQLVRKSTLESALREALKHNGLRLVYQPKIGLTPDHPLVGAEALVRWNDAALGNIPPAEFIPIAESSGLIHQVSLLTRKILLDHLTRWRQLGLLPPRIAFNVSPRTIREADFSNKFLSDLVGAGLPNTAVQIEITEGALLENSDRVAENLQILADAGIGIAIDDFGTGYSSLGYLKRLPLTELKIDKTFVDGLGRDKEDEAIARAVLALADALELVTVAEGVETAGQLAWLSEMNCDVAQGYYFARPIEANEFAAMIERRQVRGFGTGGG